MLGSLRARLVLAFVTVVVVTLAAAGVAFYSRLGSYRDALATSTLRQVALPVYFGLTLPRAGPRVNADIAAYLTAQSQHTDITVLLVDSDGRVIRDFTPSGAYSDETFPVEPAPTASPVFRQLPQHTHRTADGKTLLYIAVPIPTSNRGAGLAGAAEMIVGIPRNNSAILGDLTSRLLFAAVIGLGAAIVVGLLLAGSLTGPFRRLTRGVRAIAGGDFRTRVPVSGPAETRELAVDVNVMAGAVEQSQQALRDFLANVSHELKTPLTSIRGFSQAMLDGTLDRGEGRERAARVIEGESRRLLHLVEELLDLSRMQGGQSHLHLARVNVHELMDHVADVFDLRSQETGVALEVERPDLAVQGDYDRLEQVLGNLLDNAFRHTPRGGRVGVNVRSLNGAVEFSVADTGVGIPADEVPHVFDRFYRSTTHNGGGVGLGLGLAISREIVRSHGGEIRVVSTPGEGTRFIFTIPAAPVPAPNGRAARLSARRP